jgi:hypothetical protein
MKMGLCWMRHPLPGIKRYVFGSRVNPLDVRGLFESACEAVKDVTYVDLYVTGLTVAVGAVVAACYRYGVPLTLWHYDRDRQDYYAQDIIPSARCALCGKERGAGEFCQSCGL